MSSKKALIAMSGGVDSAVSAYLTQQEGWTVEGVTMLLWSESESLADSLCPVPDQNCRDAASVCRVLGLPHHSVSFGESFHRSVLDRFISDYACGRTPNPCVECNRHLKFGKLLRLCDEWGFDVLVTGHYAKIEPDADGRYRLKKASDSSKDQSYFLWGIDRAALGRIRFPLGNYTKPEIRAIAAEQGLPSASRSDSQDICFVPDGDYVSWIEKHSDLHFPKGKFIASDQTVLGEHQGLLRYTVGQRKGLGIALGYPAFVGCKNAVDNTVTLCTDKELYRRRLTTVDVNLLVEPTYPLPEKLDVKIRYRHTPAPAKVEMRDGTFSVCFDTPQRAIAPGQSAVLYDGDTVIGGGIIDTVDD